MSQGLEKQLENVLLDLTKDHQNSDSIDLNRQLQKLHTAQGESGSCHFGFAHA
jgi:hypothetical protein